MRLSELIEELQRYKMQDAILVDKERKVLGKPIITKHGAEGSKDLFFSITFEPVLYGTYTDEQIPPANVGIMASARRTAVRDKTYGHGSIEEDNE